MAKSSKVPAGPGIQARLDDKGRITERTVRLGAAPDAVEVRRYAYDAAGRLSRVTDGQGRLCESYLYDREARRLADINPQRFTGERRYSYSLGNRLGQAGSVQYGHNAAGFRNRKVEGTVETRYDYEPSGLLLGVDLPDGRRIDYSYDADGLRTEKRVNGRPVAEYIWLDALRLGAFFAGRQWWRLVYDPKGQSRSPVGLDNGRERYLILTDQVGTPLALAHPDGVIVQAMQYDSFGNLLGVRGEVAQLPLGFAGGLFDADTGLTRFVWRDYDADTGRFTALDPLRDKGGDPDWFGYCVDDPVNRVDVWGLFWGFGLDEGDSESGTSPWDGGAGEPGPLSEPGEIGPLPEGSGADEPSAQLGLGRGGPTWGNWGGRSHSGGLDPKDNQGQDGTAPPVDSSDEAYMRHDKGKGRCDGEDILANDPAKWRRDCNRMVDQELVKELQQLPENPKDWPRPPKQGLERQADWYRKGAIWLFK